VILYVDTSALVKRYVREARSDEVVALIEEAEAVGSTVLAQVEMASTFAKAVRQGWVEQKSAQRAWHDFLGHWTSFTRLVISAGVLERASSLAWEHGLRGYDAVHFASALIWQEAVAASVQLATFDRDLWTAAKNAGVEVWPQDISS